MFIDVYCTVYLDHLSSCLNHESRQVTAQSWAHLVGEEILDLRLRPPWICEWVVWLIKAIQSDKMIKNLILYIYIWWNTSYNIQQWFSGPFKKDSGWCYGQHLSERCGEETLPLRQRWLQPSWKKDKKRLSCQPLWRLQKKWQKAPPWNTGGLTQLTSWCRRFTSNKCLSSIWVRRSIIHLCTKVVLEEGSTEAIKDV